MILDLQNIVGEYNFGLHGVIHIGAHYGGECAVYEKCGINHMLFFEPIADTFEVLRNTTKNVHADVELVRSALGNKNGSVWMNTETANAGQSNSVLEPELHLKQYPHIQFTGKEEVPIMRLDDFWSHSETCVPSNYNFINMDVQGYELEVLKGAVSTLNGISVIMTEVNRDEVYRGCARVEQLDTFLEEHGGFRRMLTCWAGGTWGDALYVRKGCGNIR